MFYNTGKTWSFKWIQGRWQAGEFALIKRIGFAQDAGLLNITQSMIADLELIQSRPCEKGITEIVTSNPAISLAPFFKEGEK